MSETGQGGALWQSPLRAALAWLCAALVLLLPCSLLFSRGAFSSRALGYASSAISFAAALAAAATLVSERKGRGPILGLLTGGALCAVLLLLGCLINARAMNANAVLSLCSFTLAGALVGSLLGERPGKARQKSAFSHSRRRKRRA